MCGICGVINFNTKESFSTNDLKEMLLPIVHRGPDNTGTWEDKNVLLGHQRLSILDLSPLGHQPMASEDGRYHITYNGEIYNFQNLKDELHQKGYTFKSTTDTEVFLKGFQEYGIKFFEKLNGIFAGAIWDKKEEKIYLVRDRFGVKPLYYQLKGKTLIFGSEIKSILAADKRKRKVNRQAFHEFLFYGNTIGQNTLFNDVKKLHQGTYLAFDTNGATTETYWSLDQIEINNEVSTENAIKTTRSLLENAVKKQLMSDVPVGVFLSGGIDSSAVTAFAARNYSNKVSTFCASFDFEIVNELEKAKKVSKHFGTDHHEIFIKGNELPSIIKKLVTLHDEPFSDAANIPLYLLTKETAKTHKVILQGDGGDELFGGYRRYHTLAKYRKYQGAANLLNRLPFGGINDKTHRMKRYLNVFGKADDALMMALLLTIETDYDSPVNLFSKDVQQKLKETSPFLEYIKLNKKFSKHDIVQKMLWIDSQIVLPQTFLEKVDKSTMGNSVEVRVPFLDNELSEYAMSLPSSLKVKNGEKKWLLREALRAVVPDEILDAPKTGFGVPYANWIKEPLFDFFMETLNSKKIKEANLFDRKVLDKKIHEHRNNKKNNGFLLWKIFNLCLWYNMYDVEF